MKTKEVQSRHCEYTTSANGSLIKHMAAKHEREKNCKNCDYSTFSKSDLRKHVVVVHKKISNVYTALIRHPYRGI